MDNDAGIVEVSYFVCPSTSIPRLLVLGEVKVHNFFMSIMTGQNDVIV